MWDRETMLVVSAGGQSDRIARYGEGFQRSGFVPLLNMNQHHKVSTHQQHVTTHSAENQVPLEEFASWLSRVLSVKNHRVVAQSFFEDLAFAGGT